MNVLLLLCNKIEIHIEELNWTMIQVHSDGKIMRPTISYISVPFVFLFSLVFFKICNIIQQELKTVTVNDTLLNDLSDL